MVQGQWWIALGSLVQTAWVAHRFLDPAEVWRVSGAAGVGTWAGYMLMHWYGTLKRQPGVSSSHALWSMGTDRSRLIAPALALALAALLLWPVRSLVWPVVVLAMVLALAYAGPWPFKQGMRALPGVKLPLIVCCWILVTVVLPLRFDPEMDLSTGILAIGLVQLPLYSAIALLFDLRDLRTDPPSLRTIPQVIGERWSSVLVLGLLGYAGLLVVLRGLLSYSAYVEGAMPWADLGAALGFGLAAVFVLCRSSVRSPIAYAFLADGILVLIPLLYYLGSLL
jgi:hypothetical protein